jgi:arabinan endo-1,5-alpha-L-arabinosidase
MKSKSRNQITNMKSNLKNQFLLAGRAWARWVCLFSLLLMMAGVCQGQATGPFPLYGDYSLHDPGTLIKDGANYFIYGDGQGVLGKTTTDLRNWTATSAVFTGNPPAWTTNDISGFTGYFWAPDIAYFNGKYNLYYSCSQWGTINSAIGLVTSPSLTSPVWTDHGKVVESYYPATANTDTTYYNCIDPSIMVDANGSVWMSFGSYSAGILITQLDPTTGKRLNTNSLTATLVANNAPGGGWGSSEEGSCLYQRGSYYYLFVNLGGCCAGIDSTYNIRVGRSTSVTGPYYDQRGVCLTNGGGTMVLESTARFIGPGHAAIMNDNGTNWFTFHYYDGNANGYPELGLMQLNWTADGWPALTNDWSAIYPFDTDASETLGLYNGTLQNNAAITNDAARGNVLSLNGTSQYVSLPNPVANCSTLAFWAKWNGGGAWQRAFDFGASMTNYFFLTPRTSGGKMRFAITTSGSGGEQVIDAPTAMPTNAWCHVTVTLDGSKGLLYLNGNPVGTNNAMTIRPWQTMARNNYLGKSQFAADPLFYGKLDSFCIFGRPLSGTEIIDLAGVSGTWYYIQNRTSGLVIDNGGSTSAGAQMGQWAKANSSNLKWKLVASDSGYYYIQNQTSSLYLDGGGSTSNGSAVKQWSYASSSNLQWQMVASDSKYFYLKNRATGLYLDGGGATANGAALKQWSYVSSSNLQWSFQ